MDWTRQTKKQFREALTTVYPSYDLLEMFLEEDFGEQLPNITSKTGLEVVAFALLKWADAKGRLDELYRAFCKENSDNPVTQKLVQSFAQVPLPQPKATPKRTPKIRPLFEFETVRVDEQGKIIERQRKTAEYWDLDLGEGITLTLVKVPAGQFWMGSPPDEKERDALRQYPGYEDYEEGPRHLVQIPEFWMGKYPVTQMQWRRVAALPKLRVDLESDPSEFKGTQRPVEQISWDEAQEFCQRVSRFTGESVGLPSESQWEYACRAGSDTAFAFGPTLNAEIANYDANYTYDKGPKGKWREETIPVGQFPGNSWGLFDMHGNVREWCEDAWFSNYDGAPTDGSARKSNQINYRLLRGGSWDDLPRHCRSAVRHIIQRDRRLNHLGFRVCCVPPRAL